MQLLYLKTYLVAFITLLSLDAVWLGVVARSFYATRLGHLFAERITYWPALLFYVCYAAALCFFVVWPLLGASAGSSWQRVALTGLAFGFTCYMTYNFTNMATLKDWPLIVSGADLLWGSCVTAVACLVVWGVAGRFFLGDV
jgi:uncharacterized membrane protein